MLRNINGVLDDDGLVDFYGVALDDGFLYDGRFRMLAIGIWLLAIGFWDLGVGNWLLMVSGCFLGKGDWGLVAGDLRFTIYDCRLVVGGIVNVKVMANVIVRAVAQINRHRFYSWL